MTVAETIAPTIADPAGTWFAGLQARIEKDSAFAAIRAQILPHGAGTMADPVKARGAHRLAREAIARNLSGRAEAMMIAAIDAYLRHDLLLPALGARDEAAVAGFATDLARRSHAVLPPIAAEQVADMRAYFENAPVRPGDNADGGETCDVATARRQSGFARFPTAVVMDCPHMIEIATDPTVLATVEHHLGTTPTTLAFAAWWSFADRAEAEKTQCFHWDSPFDYRYCKMLVYLTDVDAGGGPHVIIDGTHELAAIDAARRRLAKSHPQFLEWYLPTTWKSDADVAAYFPQTPTTITGTAGTRFVANTRAMHKAMAPRTRDRLMCQAIYGVSPLAQVEDVGPRPAASVRGGSLPAWVTERSHGYVNRLFLTGG